MSGHRTYLGAGVTVPDGGLAIDPLAIRGIGSAKHTFNARCDPWRYNLDNPEFAAFVQRTYERGPVSTPILFRKVGMLAKSDPIYKYLLATYPQKLKEQPDQPLIETVYGNRRLYALIEANRRWVAEGKGRAKLLGVHKPMDDAAAEREFVLENSNRARTSVYEDHLTVRAELAKNATWVEVAQLLNQPEKELRRTHNPLRQAHMAVVQAYSVGAITRARLLQIVKLDMKDQPDELDAPVAAKVARPRPVKLDIADVPLKALRQLLDNSNAGVSDDNYTIAKTWLLKMEKLAEAARG